jgi:hypothetical protein
MKRKIIQIAVEREQASTSILAVADDGTLWKSTFKYINEKEGWGYSQWTQLKGLPDIPQGRE